MKMNRLHLAILTIAPALLVGCGNSEDNVTAREPVNPAAVKAFAEAGINVNPSQAVQLNQELARLVMHGEVNQVQEAIKNGATTDAADRYGLKVIFSAAQWGKTDILNALIKAGANVNETVATSHSTDGQGYGGTRSGTPMTYAAQHGRVECLKILKNAGGNINGSGPEGNTPLMRAAEGGQLEVVKWLLQNGANANAKNNTGQNALSPIAMIINPDQKRLEIARLIKAAQK